MCKTNIAAFEKQPCRNVPKINSSSEAAIRIHFSISLFSSSRPEVFCKKGVLRSFAKFTGKHLCQSLFFNKVSSLRPTTLFKKKLWHRCFPVNSAKFPWTHFIIEHLWWLLLAVLQLLWNSLKNTCDGVQFLVNIHVTLFIFEPLLRKSYISSQH